MGAYLVAQGAREPEDGQLFFKSRQGGAMTRPGAAHVLVEAIDGVPETVCIGGHARIVFSTILQIRLILQYAAPEYRDGPAQIDILPTEYW